MRAMRGWGRAAVGILGMVVAAAGFGMAQLSPAEGGGRVQGQYPRQGESADAPGPDAAWNAKRLKALNEDRHKSMVSDAQKLLKLARQLDAEVASNPTDEVTPEELHKVSEIEKLAKSVKSKMAQSFTGGPQLRGPAIPIGNAEVPRLQ